MRYDVGFGDAIYVFYASWRDDFYSPSTSVWMVPGSYVED